MTASIEATSKIGQNISPVAIGVVVIVIVLVAVAMWYGGRSHGIKDPRSGMPLDQRKHLRKVEAVFRVFNAEDGLRVVSYDDIDTDEGLAYDLMIPDGFAAEFDYIAASDRFYLSTDRPVDRQMTKFQLERPMPSLRPDLITKEIQLTYGELLSNAKRRNIEAIAAREHAEEQARIQKEREKNANAEAGNAPVVELSKHNEDDSSLLEDHLTPSSGRN